MDTSDLYYRLNVAYCTNPKGPDVSVQLSYDDLRVLMQALALLNGDKS